MVPHGEEFQLRQVVLQRVHPDGLDVHRIAAHRQQQRASADDLRGVTDPHRDLLVDRPVVVDVGVDLLRPWDEHALRNLEAKQSAVLPWILQGYDERAQVSG